MRGQQVFPRKGMHITRPDPVVDVDVNIVVCINELRSQDVYCVDIHVKGPHMDVIVVHIYVKTSTQRSIVYMDVKNTDMNVCQETNNRRAMAWMF